MINVGRIRKRINIESNNNPINYPCKNNYGKVIKSYSDFLMKEKKKFPDFHGNNVEFPEYLKINYLKDEKLSKEFLPKNQNGLKKIKFEPKENKIVNSKKIIAPINNHEDPIFTPRTYEFKPFRSYNILSGKPEKIYFNNKPQGNIFARLAYINMFVNENDKNNVLITYNNNHHLNDGVYDYLKENKYI